MRSGAALISNLRIRADANGTNAAARRCVSRLSAGRRSEITQMRLVLALIVIVYLVGVGVVLSPVVRSTWDSAPASALAESVAQALPDALAWPVRAAHAVTGS
jgi:hypothetical protein